MDLHKTLNIREPGERYFISIGAGNHQLPLIRAARDLGMPVIVVDRNLQAPGFQLADIQLQCSIRKPGKIIRMIQENMTRGKIVGVASRSYGVANLSAAHVAHSFGTPGISIPNVKTFYNKRKLKERARRAGVAVPTFYTWKTEQERERLLSASLPLIARPVSGHGKLGIRLLREQADLESFLEEHPVDDGRFLVEELLEGQEVTVLGFVKKGLFHTVTITDKIVSEEPPLFAEIFHRYPSTINSEQENMIRNAMQNLVSHTGIETGPMVAEFILAHGKKRKTEKAYLVEAAPEVGGEYLADVLIPTAFKTNYFHDLVRLFTSQEKLGILENLTRSPEQTILIRFILQREGVFRDVQFPEYLKDHPGLLFSKVLRNPGDVTSLSAGNIHRLAVFALKGPIAEADLLEDDMQRIVRDTVVLYDP